MSVFKCTAGQLSTNKLKFVNRQAYHSASTGKTGQQIDGEKLNQKFGMRSSFIVHHCLNEQLLLTAALCVTLNLAILSKTCLLKAFPAWRPVMWQYKKNKVSCNKLLINIEYLLGSPVLVPFFLWNLLEMTCLFGNDVLSVFDNVVQEVELIGRSAVWFSTPAVHMFSYM